MEKVNTNIITKKRLKQWFQIINKQMEIKKTGTNDINRLGEKNTKKWGKNSQMLEDNKISIGFQIDKKKKKKLE